MIARRHLFAAGQGFVFQSSLYGLSLGCWEFLRGGADFALGVRMQDEIDAQVELIARQAGEKPARVHKEFERTGQMAALRSEMKIQRAMDWLIEQVELVDEDGNAIDRTLLEPPSDDDGSPEDTE